MQKLIRHPGILLVIIVAVYFGSFPFIIKFLGYCPPTNSGEYGDTFGAVNALFGAIGIFGIIYSLRIQQDEINTQNKELNLQRFESTFFTLLNTHFKIVEMLEGESTNGYKYLRIVGDRFKDISLMPDEVVREKKLKSAVELYYPTLSIYFQSLLQVYVIIKKAEFKPEIKKSYYNVLRSYITPLEKEICWAYEKKLTGDGKGNLKFHFFIEEVLGTSTIENELIE